MSIYKWFKHLFIPLQFILGHFLPGLFRVTTRIPFEISIPAILTSKKVYPPKSTAKKYTLYLPKIDCEKVFPNHTFHHVLLMYIASEIEIEEKILYFSWYPWFIRKKYTPLVHSLVVYKFKYSSMYEILGTKVLKTSEQSAIYCPKYTFWYCIN